MTSHRNRPSWAIALFAFACSNSSNNEDAGPAPIVPCPYGQMDKPAEMELVHQETDGRLVETTTTAIAEIPLFDAEQGGFIARFSARARNMDICNLTLKTTLRDPCDGHIVGLDFRPVTFEPNDDGWARPKRPERLTNYSALQVCPAAREFRALHSEPYILTVELSDPEGRTAVKTSTVTMKCQGTQESLNRCLCDCRNNYVLGEECRLSPDAGAPPGVCPPDDAGM